MTEYELVNGDMHKIKHRKTLFRKQMFEDGYKLGALGLTIAEIADFWKVSERSVMRWMRKYPDFKAEIEKGKREADLKVIQVVFNEATLNHNITAAIFWLKNRRKEWRNGNKQPDPPPNNSLDDLSTDQLIAILQNNGEHIAVEKKR